MKNQHVTSVGQRENLSPRQDSNLWSPKHQADALSTWATENSWRARPYTRFILFSQYLLGKETKSRDDIINDTINPASFSSWRVGKCFITNLDEVMNPIECIRQDSSQFFVQGVNSFIIKTIKSFIWLQLIMYEYLNFPAGASSIKESFLFPRGRKAGTFRGFSGNSWNTKIKPLLK